MLTDAQVKRAKPEAKPLKLFDGGGMFLLVTPAGAKSWRLKYRVSVSNKGGGSTSKEKLLTLGQYPHVSLVEARARRDDAKRELAAGVDPSVEKKKRAANRRADAANTFEAIATEWFELNKSRWSPSHSTSVLRSLERDLFPELGSLPIRDISEALLLEQLRVVEKRGSLETAKRVRQRASDIFAFAAAAGLRTGDPAAVIKTLMQPARKRGKQPALTDLGALRQMMSDVEASSASAITKLANRLIALTAVRVGALQEAKWEQFEGLKGEQPLWRVPPSSMKLKVDKKDDAEFEHLVPLSRQAVEAIEALRPLTGRFPYVFPNERHAHRPMSNNAVRSVIIRADGGKYLHKHCPHGYRASFSSIMNEWRRQHGRPDDREVIDLMLAHVANDKTEGAYNRAQHMPRRRELAQLWADMLFAELPPASDLVPS